MDKKVLSSLPQEVAWYWHVARTGYDLVVDFQQLPRCRWVVAFSGAPVRLSYTPPWYTSLLYTHSSDMLDGYSAMSKASVLRPLGIEWNGERPRVYLTGEAFIDNEGRASLSERFGAEGLISADMETAAVAQVCRAAGVPFCCVRAISDTEEERGFDVFLKNVAEASVIAAAAVADMLEYI